MIEAMGLRAVCGYRLKNPPAIRSASTRTAERTGLPVVQSGDLVGQQAEAEVAEAALAGNALLQPLGPCGRVEDKITCHDMALSRCFDITDIVPPHLCCNAQ